MKKILLITFNLIALLGVSGGSTITFELDANNKPILKTGNKTDLTLPLNLNFSSAFLNKSIEIKDPDKNTLTGGELHFGQNGLSANPDGSFTFIIEKDKKTNPGGNLIDFTEFKLILEKVEFDLKLASIKTPENDPLNPGNSEDYAAGHIYYDVFKLLDKNTSPQKKVEILLSYGIDKNNISQNPYLKDNVEISIFAESQGGLTGALGSIGGADVTYFAAGLANFLAERTKEELNEAFFRKMKDQINAYPELSTLFPKTNSFLNIIETYAYSSILQVLKEAFETDVENLPENQYKLKSLTLGSCSTISSKTAKQNCEDRIGRLNAVFNTRNGKWIALGMLTVKEAVSATNPAELLTAIKVSSELTNLKDPNNIADYNICASIELSDFISHSLISKEGNQVWVNSQQMNRLFTNEKAFKIYLGLLLCMEKTVADENKVVVKFLDKGGNELTFGDALMTIHKTAAEFNKYKPHIKELIKNSHTAFNSANSAIRKMIKAVEGSETVEPQALYDYYTTFTAAIKPIAHSQLLNDLTSVNIAETYDKLEVYLNPSVDMAYHISVKKYSAAVYDAVLLLNNTNSSVLEKPVAKAFIKYGTLISTVATAKSSEEVKDALEASVLPVGSSAVKRRSAWSITANAYVGGFRGWTHTKVWDTVRVNNKLDTVSKSLSDLTFGLYAPVGLTFSRGIYPGWGSISLSAQLIDVGALVNFYMISGNNAALPPDFKVKLSDIVAPGIQIGWDIPKTPISIFYGRQYVPMLYKTSQINTGTEPFNAITWRSQISVVVDIPLYNLKVSDYKHH